ncbi:MAG: dihydrofolate reductase [Bacteroidota bacterium]|nr:dihydrofolate reductase [Bacteroidota bacterium]
MDISLVVAVAENGVIGKDNRLLWRLSADLQRFRRLTLGHHILMGRKTYDSIGRPLPGRTSLIISKDENLKIDGAIVFNDINKAIDLAKENNETELFIIGGGDVFDQTIKMAETIYMTEVKVKLEGDAFFKYDPKEWFIEHQTFTPADEKNEYDTMYIVLKRIQK